MSVRSATVALLLAACCWSGRLHANEEPSAPDEIAAAVRQLGADRFADRQAASQTLYRFGKEAFPALAEAAGSDNAEVRGRAVELLRRHWKNGDDSSRQAAEAALQQIAESGPASAANLAKQALKPEELHAQAMPGIQVFPAGGFAPAQIQIQINAVQNANRQIRMRQANGVKDVEVQENGRKIKIHEDPNQGIKVEVTETKDGKETTSKYEAKNADELKKNHPEGHKLYEQFGQGQAGQIRAGQIRINAVPAIPPPAPVPAARPNEEARKQIDETIERLKQNAQRRANPESVKRMIQNLEEFRERIGQ